MDINEIYFSNLKNLTGEKTRRLNLIELSQIAGRAGRYQNMVVLELQEIVKI